MLGQVMDDGRGREDAGQGDRPRAAPAPAPDAIARAIEVMKGAKRPLIVSARAPPTTSRTTSCASFVEKSGYPFLPMSMAKGASARHPSAMRRRGAVDGAEGLRRRHHDGRADQLAALARQGQAVGRAGQRSGSSRSTSTPKEMDSNVEIAAPLVGDVGSCVGGAARRRWSDEGIAPPTDWLDAVRSKADGEHGEDVAPRLQNNNMPMDYHAALGVLKDVITERPDTILVNEGANTLDLARSIIEHAQAAPPHRRRHLGRHGDRHGRRRSPRRSRPASGCWRSRATAPSGSAAWRWRRSAATTCRSASWSSTTTASTAATA